MHPLNETALAIGDLLEIPVIAIIHRGIAHYPMEQGLPVHFRGEMASTEVKRLAEQVLAMGGPGRYGFGSSRNHDKVCPFQPVVFHGPEYQPHMVGVEMRRPEDYPWFDFNSYLPAHVPLSS